MAGHYPTMRIEPKKYPGLIVTDLDRPGTKLHHLVWIDTATGEYEHFPHYQDGTLRKGDNVTRKGRLMLDWRFVAEPPAEA